MVSGLIATEFPAPKGVVGKTYQMANLILARKPSFAVIGTGRSGTGYFSELCRANGIYCSHEGYYTTEGPKLRNPRRRFTATGDCSWMAVPYLPDEDVRVAHQLRHPEKVIGSFFNIGFFDPAHSTRRISYVTFSKRHFDWSDDPLRSCVRYYIEWNKRCELITPNRYRVEDMNVEQVGEWLGINLVKPVAERGTNSRTPKVDTPFQAEWLKDVPEYRELQDNAGRYGYDI